MRSSFIVAGCVVLTLGAGCGRHRNRGMINAAPNPDLEARADKEAHASSPNGERMPEVLRGVAYEEDGFTDWRVQLEPGNCYAFGFAGDGGVQKFAMYIWGPDDKRLDSARGRGPEGVFSHCAQFAGMYRVQGKVQEGTGHYAVVVYKTKGAAPAPPPPSAPVDLAATIEKQASSAAPGAKRIGDFYAGSAERSEWYTALEAGKCYWFIGAGEPGHVKKLYLYLWDPKAHRITESRSDSEITMVGHCATMPGMYKFEARVDSGSGQYKVGVYAK